MSDLITKLQLDKRKNIKCNTILKMSKVFCLFLEIAIASFRKHWKNVLVRLRESTEYCLLRRKGLKDIYKRHVCA